MYSHKTISLADQIFERLETDILIGKYSYGEILTESKLSEELGVSRTPVREALRRLHQEKLIAETQRGIMVLGITLDDIRDIYNIRIPIEEMAVVRFIDNMTPETLRALKDIVDIQEFYGTKKDNEHVFDKDNEFHEMIYKGCGSHILTETLIPLHRKVVKYRKASLEHKGRAEKSIMEHRAIYEAIAAKDKDLAVKIMEEHICNAKESILGGK